MTKYNHPQISTNNNTIEVGKTYQYKEDSAILLVEILEDNSDNEKVAFKLKVLDNYNCRMAELCGLVKDKEFDVSAAYHNGAYSGMWRLYPENAYMFCDR